MGWLIGLIFSLLMTFGGIVSYSMEKKVEELVVVVIFVLLDICCIKKYRDKKTGKTAEKKQKKKDSKEMLSRMITGKHQAGLPLSQDTSVVTY